MNENYRHAQLLKLVNDRKAISTAEIIELLQISPATARRDITKLHEQGRLRKVRNGAESLERHKAESHLGNIANLSDKQSLALAASSLCKNGESVVITCGSTMLVLGAQLCGHNLQITTNYLPLANYLIEQDHDNVVIMGGQYNKNQAITLSWNSQLEYAANIMFTSAKGITSEGVYKNDILIANSEQKMLAKIDKLVVLVESSKLGKRGGMLFSDLSQVDLLITNKNADPDIIRQLKEKGLEIILA